MGTEFYLVVDLPVTNERGDQDFKFSDCKTIEGCNLPKFKEPPVIFPFDNANQGVFFRIQEVTSVSFNLNWGGGRVPFNINVLVFPRHDKVSGL